MGIARAREFVLRDKRKVIQNEVDRICRPYWDAPDNADRTLLAGRIKADLEAAFATEIHLRPEEFEELLFHAMEPSGFEIVATLIAKKLLDRDPPSTKPVWGEPWGRGFGCLDLEQARERSAGETEP